MSTVPHNFTAEQLMALPDDGNRYELVRGELRMMSPAGGRHGQVAMRLGSLLEQHVRRHQLGYVFAAETGFLIGTNPDTVRAPDVAFVSAQQMARLDDLDGYLAVAPDLVAEVVSPHDTSSEVEGKAEMWIDAGTAMVLVVDPANQSIRVYRNRCAIEVLHPGDQLDAHEVVAEWKLTVAEVFS